MKVVAHIRLSLATGYCFIQQPSTASMHIALYLRSNHMLEDFVPAAYTSYRMVYVQQMLVAYSPRSCISPLGEGQQSILWHILKFIDQKGTTFFCGRNISTKILPLLCCIRVISFDYPFIFSIQTVTSLYCN